MLDEFQKIFHSIAKSLEILYVLEEKKPCARILVHQDRKLSVENFLKEKNLNFDISNFKLIKEMNSEFYSDKSYKVPNDSLADGYFAYYISKDDKCKAAKIFEKNDEYENLGQALGYPKCCCDFFTENFNGDNTDLALDSFENSNGYEFPFQMNISARHFDISLLSHFPCSFNCEESLKIAKENLKVVHTHSKDLSSIFSNMLRSVVISNENEGIFLLVKYEKIIDQIIYADVLGTKKSKLYYLLASNKKLSILNKNTFEIDGEKIKSPIMAFS